MQPLAKVRVCSTEKEMMTAYQHQHALRPTLGGIGGGTAWALHSAGGAVWHGLTAMQSVPRGRVLPGLPTFISTGAAPHSRGHQRCASP
jgi:hypothetical protein